MKRLFFVMGPGLGIALAWQAAQATDVYRWVDKDGKVHYGQTAVRDAEKVKVSAAEAEAESGVGATTLPYEARLAHKNFPLALYVSEACADSCQQAREFLNKRRVPYTVTVLKTDADVAAFKQKSGTEVVPTLSVGRSWIKGFQPDQWRDELDASGYPK